LIEEGVIKEESPPELLMIDKNNKVSSWDILKALND